MKLIIELEDSEDIESAIAEVHKKIGEGFTSGYEPNWYITA